jgi:hypothetical protein
MSEAEMNEILTEVFDKFDRDGNGTMELREFRKAWSELNLSGSDKDVLKAFKDVDVDKSGVIELKEFQQAIRGERLAELNMNTLVTNLDGTIDSLDKYMKNFKSKYEKAVATARRRRQNQGDIIRRIAERSTELLAKFEEVNNEEVVAQDEEGAKMYRQLLETYDAFDNDGNGELQFKNPPAFIYS